MPPDISDGLTVGNDDEFDIDTTAGFTAMLAKQAGVELSEERLSELREKQTSVASGLTTESPKPQSRDESGRFTPEATVEEEAEETAPDEETEEVAPDPASKQLEDAQSFIGKQSAEIGELRERLARLEGAQEAKQEQPPQQLPYVSDEQIADAVVEHGLAKVINDLTAAGFPDDHEVWHLAFSEAIDNGEKGAGAAYQRYLALMNQPAEQAPNETLKAIEMQAHVEHTLDSVLAKYPDVDGPTLAATIEDEATPEWIRENLDSADAAVREQALEVAALLSRTRTVSDKANEAEAERKAAVTETKKSLAVGSGSLSPSSSGSPEVTDEETVESATKRLQDRILAAADGTSIKSGLTFGS